MRAFAKTDVGQKRRVNQDYVFSSPESVGKLPNLYIVADGMGGHKAGDFASRFVVETLIEYIKYENSSNPVTIINNGIHLVNSKLLEESYKNPELSGMGTTLVVATINGNSLCVANVGDSRLYVINRQAQQITRDHSLVEEMVVRGELVRDSQNYLEKKNIITRAIGAAFQVEADFFEIELKQDDYILMCSDGLTNMLTDKEIGSVVQSLSELSEKASQLITMANERGGKDNIAVLLVNPEISEVDVC